jgi:TRAP-type C4-dicarboxylate transport system substrate-binding protein
MTARRTGITRRVLGAAALAGALTLTACAEDTSSDNGDDAGSGGSTEGVEYGASKDDYQAAFEDIDPITLHTQTPGPQGSSTSKKFEEYFEAVEDWSDGKITFDIAYSNAVAPPTEIDNALQDGRLDLGLALPIYEPSEYPASSSINEISFIGRQTPVVGVMESHAWMLDVMEQTPEMQDEFESKGVHVLLPAFNSGHSHMVCTEERTGLDDFNGAQILSGGSRQAKQIEALGGTPVSIPYTEVYESLSRGVAQCTVSSMLGIALGGYADVANKVAVDPDTGFAITTGNIAVNAGVWEDLPLEARQLLFDRLDVFLQSSVRNTWAAIAEAVSAIDEAGGGFKPFDDDAKEALQKANDGFLDDIRSSAGVEDPGAFVDLAEDSSDKWHGIVTDDLGYDDVDTYLDFVKWYEDEGKDIDLEPYASKVFEETLLDQRP